MRYVGQRSVRVYWNEVGDMVKVRLGKMVSLWRGGEAVAEETRALSLLTDHAELNK